jgi:Domain of unknown function (DUF892)
VKDIYYAEKKIFRTLPKMAKAAKLPELRQAFTTHREGTQGQIERLEQVFEMTGKQTNPCEAINGVVAEGEETIRILAKASRSIPVWLQPANRSNTTRSRATAHSLRANQLDMPNLLRGLENLLADPVQAQN